MAITRIKVSNFKSFQHLDVPLGKLNVLIGANASGKSNFIKIFEFLRDIPNSGLTNAISLQGGIGYLRNLNIGKSKSFSLKVTSNKSYGRGIRDVLLGTDETTYELALKFVAGPRGFRIQRDKLTQKGDVDKVKEQKGEIRKKVGYGPSEVVVSCKNGRIKVDLSIPKGVPVKQDEWFPPFVTETKVRPECPILETPQYFWFVPPSIEISGEISIYNFDPKLSKTGVQITGKAELEEDGRNLALVLKNLLESREKKRKLTNLMRDLLPFVDDLDIETFADRSLLFKAREVYFKDEYLPASMLSDGTINVTALIIALYFEKEPLTIVEEPERNIHPFLISKVMEMMKEASKNKQIIVTTHNPEIVKHAGLENLLLVSRDEQGFSTVSRPADKKEVKAFLRNQIGIDELYIQNLLGV